MKNKIEIYMENVEEMRYDFTLIFNNCFAYNLPKDKVYKEGQRIKALIDRKIEEKFSKLQEFAEANKEELEHENWIKQQIETNKDFFLQDIKIPEYKLTPTLEDVLGSKNKEKNKMGSKFNESDDEKMDQGKNLVELLQNPSQLEDLDIKQYYNNPVRCCFDNPALAFETICFLCGSFGNDKEFLSCNLCGESFHTYCVKISSDELQNFQGYWKCSNCKYCEVCCSAEKEDQLLYCDKCDKAFHTFCQSPQIPCVPNCGW